MGKKYSLRLREEEIGQLLDGLQSRADVWRGTAQYFESGTTPHSSFIIEESRDVDEARSIAEAYESLIHQIQRQLKSQRTATAQTKTSDTVPENSEAHAGKEAFCICRHTFFQDHSIAVIDEFDRPCIFDSEREAQVEIADHMITRLQEFMQGERDFDDAICSDEYTQPVRIGRGGEILSEEYVPLPK